MIKVGIIGLGKMGICHAAIVNSLTSVKLVSVCDTSSLVLDTFRKFTGMQVYNDYVTMLDSEELDFVIVSTPTRFHYKMVKYALEMGIHTFCEKPFSLTAKEGEDLVAIAGYKNLINQVGYHNHFVGTFRELKRLLNADVIGDLVHFTGEAYGPVVTKEKGGTWRSEPEEGGGCLYDYASHVINLIQEILGRPAKAYGSQLKRIYSKKVEDAVYSTLILENGLSGILSVNWSDDTYRKMSTSITVHGKKGKIICDATEIKIYMKEANEKENLGKSWTTKYITEFAIPVSFYLRGEEYSAQLEYFVENVKNKRQGKYNTFEKGLYTDRVIEMILENAKQN